MWPVIVPALCHQRPRGPVSCGCVAEMAAPGSPLADDDSKCILPCLVPSFREGVPGVALQDVGLVSRAWVGQHGGNGCFCYPATSLTSGK